MQTIRKAVIPAAGFGTRLFPATKAVRKPFFPVPDADGYMKPAIQAIAEEAVRAGIEEIIIIVNDDDIDEFRRFFNGNISEANMKKLPPELRIHSEHILDIGRRTTFAVQKEQEGFGHAVYCAREAVGSEPFLLLLGDRINRSGETRSCAAQVLDIYEIHGKMSMGLYWIPIGDVGKRGVVKGLWLENGRLLDVRGLFEKPDPAFARRELQISGRYLAAFGLYAIDPEIFTVLEKDIAEDRRERGEFQLTTALDGLGRKKGMLGLVVNGKSEDIGTPEGYIRTILSFSEI